MESEVIECSIILVYPTSTLLSNWVLQESAPPNVHAR